MNKLKRIVFIASIAFNCAVLAGLARGSWSARAHASNDPSFAPLFRNLNLSSGQREQLNRSNLEALDRILATRDQMRRRWAEGIGLLSTPNIDWDAVRSKQVEISTAQEAYQSVFFQVWMDRAKDLTPEQRRQLFDGVRVQIENGTFFNWRAPERSPREATK